MRRFLVGAQDRLDLVGVAGLHVDAGIDIDGNDVAIPAGDALEVVRSRAGESATEDEVIRIVLADGGGGDGEISFSGEPVEFG